MCETYAEMDGEERASLELELRERHARGDFRAVATRAVEVYGPEILGFLTALFASRAEGDEVFGRFCEDLWTGLPSFRWESSFRTWAYALARNAAHRFRRHERIRNHLPLSEAPGVSLAAELARTTTLVYLRSEVKDRVRELRDGLDPEDQMVLILRVDRKMSWLEMAAVMLGPEQAGGPELTRKAASLRKRFERIKLRLRRELGQPQSFAEA